VYNINRLQFQKLNKFNIDKENGEFQ